MNLLLAANKDYYVNLLTVFQLQNPPDYAGLLRYFEAIVTEKTNWDTRGCALSLSFIRMAPSNSPNKALISRPIRIKIFKNKYNLHSFIEIRKQ